MKNLLQTRLQNLQPPKAPPPPSWRVQKRGLICLGLGFLLIFAAVATVDYEGPGLLTWILVAACALLIVTGFVLIALGPRADKNEGRKHEGD